ncbi:MAG: FAD-binding oxidoreductase [Rhodospirillales bacterium]|nr:FAD-binding oxidoreductase [Rhodospirillales bacterium]
MRVVIIGAGVIGTSVAFRLAERGTRTILIEEDRPGAGATGASFAWLHARDKQPRAYHDLNVASMAAHAALRSELGAVPWLHGGGALAWPVEDADVGRLRRWGYAVEEISREAVLAREPGLAAAAMRDGPFAYFPDEAWLDAVVYVGAMLIRAKTLGAELRRDRVEDLLIEEGRVAGVRLADGTTVPADAVVNCAGAWANTVVRDPSLHVPLRPTRSLLVVTPPVATGLSRVLHTPGVNLRPDGSGRLMLQSDTTDAELAQDNTQVDTAASASMLMDRARALLPAIGGATAETTRIGVRPVPADLLPALGPVPGVPGYHIAVTPNAVTLAAHIGRLMAVAVTDGRLPPALSPFAAARFFDGESSPRTSDASPSSS